MSSQSPRSPHAMVVKLAQQFSENHEAHPPVSYRVPTEVYTSEIQLQQEIDKVFRRQPLLLGHVSQIPESGDALIYDWLDTPIITVRNKAGEINSFLNVCRHRGMRLVQEQGATQLRSMVCPYHQWTYGLEGELRNVPLCESFPNLNTDEHALVPLPTQVSNGLIWVQLDTNSSVPIDTHLAGLQRDLTIFEMEKQCVFKQHQRTVKCNWKLIQDAFLDGYHVVRLHKNTVGPYFPDSVVEYDKLGMHIRSAVARNELAQAQHLTEDQVNLRLHCTFSYTVFPNSVIIFHPDYTSLLTLIPQGVDETLFKHIMLTPHAPTSDKERDHFERSFELIDKGVFQAEDIFVSEGTQRGFASGANSHLLFGTFEEPAAMFHQQLQSVMS